MAKGFQAHQERMQQLSLFGKELARRAKSKCEICEASGVPLSIYEIPPVPNEPEIGKCVFACEKCAGALENPKKALDPNEWRGLGNTIWTEVPAVQVAVVRLLKRISPKADWARELLEQAYLDEDILTWAAKES